MIVDKAIVDAVGLAIVGVLQSLGMFLSNRNHKKIQAVSTKQDKIYELVNHPYGKALEEVADALEVIAEKGDDEDKKKAREARARSDEHNTRQLIADAKAARIARGTSSEKVCLLVEDDKTTAKLVTEQAAFANWSVDWAGTAEEARGLVRNRIYRIVFVDMRLPGESGWSFIKWLRTINKTSHIVVLLTTIDDIKNIDPGVSFSVMLKPSTVDGVAQVLGNA